MMFAAKMEILILQFFLTLISLTSIGFSSPIQTLQVNQPLGQNIECECGDYDGSGDTEGCCTDGDETLLPTVTTRRKPRVLSLRVESTITARYVSTTVVTKIKNEAKVSKDTNFWFRLSEGAFISDFFMEVKGQIYQADVQEKEAAQKAYNEAKRRGQTASQVKQSQHDLRKFETNINLSPNTTATFHLTFQELLRRKNGVFQHRINLFPKEVVRNLMADVYITEPQGISFANITWEQDSTLTTDFLYDALNVHYKSDTEVHALFNPSEVDQEGLSESGLQGDLVITYDVVHDTGAGHIEIVNGYFVHHISPVNLPASRKDVVFVLDTSGSMYGHKLAQTKKAMETIIDDIRDFDRFNIIQFHSAAILWRRNLVRATKSNKEEAKKFVNELAANGGTNILNSLKLAVRSLKDPEEESDPSSGDEGSDDLFVEATDHPEAALPMIILLTDGQGGNPPSVVVQEITDAIQGEIAVFCLAFGTDADYKLLEKLSGHNQGLARQIYEDSSASLQLAGFYEEVATPLLHHISVTYPEDKVDPDTLTQTNFISYFEGTELVIAGKLKDEFTGNELSAVVTANSLDVNYEWGLTKEILRSKEETDKNTSVLKPRVVEDFAQRLWACATIKDLLAKRNIAISSTEKDSFREKALSLALKYKFVTPLTSLIIIKPNEEKSFDESIGEDAVPAPRTSPVGRSHSRGSGAAGDPHILVEDPYSEVRLCFDIHGPEGTVVNLVEDPILGVTVNGEMVEKDNFTAIDPRKPTPSFFGRIAIQLGDDWITVSGDGVFINEDRHLEWGSFSEAVVRSCRLEFFEEKLLKLSCENGVVMKVSRHQIPEETHNHFDFFLGEGRMFSESVNGIIGQFQRRSIRVVESSVHPLVKYGGAKAQLSVDGKSLNVHEIYRPLTGTCWATYAKNGLPMLETKYEDYLLPNLYSKLPSK